MKNEERGRGRRNKIEERRKKEGGERGRRKEGGSGRRNEGVVIEIKSWKE